LGVEWLRIVATAVVSLVLGFTLALGEVATDVARLATSHPSSEVDFIVVSGVSSPGVIGLATVGPVGLGTLKQISSPGVLLEVLG
jgi:hypothetical protein